ncbi:gas vesicle protein [Rubrimonas cliftonensis]|uniref:Gas vesicle protein n=1 Tax=Rubrimonas cliftonensis TaxID=89524 RepID=A0A1H4ALR8_9RHOB|nr:gas vesicle protein [Rubrimonas cliftonensis]SEA36893.1 Gas vesicle protein [Rubrimonas cliftonensis]
MSHAASPAPAATCVGEDAALVDVIDRLLARGVVVRGELWLTVADVELVYVGAQIVLASPEAVRASWSAGR